MGFIKKLLNTSQPSPPALPSFDFCLGDPDLRSGYDRLLTGDVAGFDAFCERREDDWLVITALLDDESNITTAHLGAWATAHPHGRSIGWLGRAEVKEAWAIRGTTYAEHVADEAWGPFHQGLQTAEATFGEAARVNPGSADPWIGLITAGLGLGRDLNVVLGHFNAAQARAPFRPDACHAALQALCDKWLGSHEEMFDFARWIDAEAPPASAARSVLPLAHLEYAQREASETRTLSWYLSKPDVSKELRIAARRFLDASPAIAEIQHLSTLNHYAMMLTPVDVETARLVEECIRRIAGRPTGGPWNRFGNPAQQYKSITNKVLRRAATF